MQNNGSLAVGVMTAAFTIACLLTACSPATPAANIAETRVEAHRSGISDVSPKQAGMGDPSVKHCQEKGYRPEAVQQDGIVSSYLCVDDANGKKCDSWAYFREECRLE